MNLTLNLVTQKRSIIHLFKMQLIKILYSLILTFKMNGRLVLCHLF
jgi:hypothetical protein